MVPKQAEAASSTRPSVILLGCRGSLASLQAWRRAQGDEAGAAGPGGLQALCEPGFAALSPASLLL